MKLTALNTAIRKNEGAPKFDLRFFAGDDEVVLSGLEITKQSLLNALKAAFPEGGRSTETRLRLNPTTGHLEREPAECAEQDVAPAADPLADVLGDDAPAADPLLDMLG